MKRIGEKFRQKLGITGKGNEPWQPTSNKRNEAMEVEVRRFAQSLKLLHKELQGLDASVHAGISTVRTVLLTPLPHAFDELTPGQATMMELEERLLGTNVNLDSLQASSTEMHGRLQHEVLLPLEQWLSEYRNTKAQNKKCETLRLDLDEKRRATLVLHEKLEKLRQLNHKDVEVTATRVQAEEDKLARLAQRYQEKEAEVFNAFLRLIRDSAVLRDYAALALAILQRCFTSAYTSFDLTAPTPAPALPAPAPVPSLTYSAEQSMRLSNGSGVIPRAGSPTMAARATHSSGGGNPLGNPGVAAGGGSYVYQAPPSPNADKAQSATGFRSDSSTPQVYASAPPAARSSAGSQGGKAPVPAWYAEQMGKSARGPGTPPPVPGSESGEEDGANPFHKVPA